MRNRTTTATATTGKNCFAGNLTHTHTPGHPRPFGSGIGLSMPVAEMEVYGEETPDPEWKGGALLDSAAVLWESIFSLRFGRNSFMTSLTPSSWSGGTVSLESWRFSRLAERTVEWDLESK